MRTLILMTALLSSNALYAAPVCVGGALLSADSDGDPVQAPWVLNIEDDDALPDGLSIGGLAIVHFEVHSSGLVVINGGGFDAAPAPLDEVLMASVVAPFWAAADADACRAAAPGAVRRIDGEAELTLTWRDMPLGDCEADDQRATFGVTLGWDEHAAIDRLEFRYETLPAETLTVEPRAGLRLQERGVVRSTFELLPDPDGSHLRGRAKLLLDGSSDGLAGLWIIELGENGQVIGEREPEHFEDDDVTPRRPDGRRESDNCPAYFNPLQEDTDEDGTGDVCDDDADDDGIELEDNCPLVVNLDQADLDEDGQGDACDPDDDADGWPDAFDRCPQHPDTGNRDLDRDGVGDVCDLDPDGDDDAARLRAPLRRDTCPFVFDPARGDLDGDGLGDACDLLPWTACRFTCVWQRDSDGDGVGDVFDACPTAHDPDQSDRDADGVGDACDPDDDGNGIYDVLEVLGWFEAFEQPPSLSGIRPLRLP